MLLEFNSSRELTSSEMILFTKRAYTRGEGQLLEIELIPEEW